MHSPENRERVVRSVLDADLIDDERQVAAVLDLDHLAGNVAALHAAFPQDLDVFHAFAVKANPVVPVLRELRMLGLGAEAASHGELTRALAAGHSPGSIVFDSPAKTRSELLRALELGVAMNIDNFQELERVRELIDVLGAEPAAGIRVNPQVGEGEIGAMSTAGATSKFGVPLCDAGNRERIVEAYLELPWLRRLHAHIGSQGCPLPLIAQGICAVTELADEINSRAGETRIDTIDIGGGLPVDFSGDARVSRFDDYVGALAEGAPRLFSGDYALVTEFGRSILAKSGFMLSRIEYTKTVGGRRIATSHIGANVAARTVFMPDSWPLRVEAYGPAGDLKRGVPVEVQDVAGPCCFAGDLVARARELPVLEPGDHIAVLDTGAYYASNPYDYNSLPVPGIYGVRSAGSGPAEGPEFTTLREPSESS